MGKDRRKAMLLDDAYLKEHKYEVESLRPNTRGYPEEVKSLVEKFEVWMNMAETDPWDVAIKVEVTHAEEDLDIPF